MDDTLGQVLAAMTEVKRPQRQFMIALFTVFMSFVGRATLRNLGRYTKSACERTLSRWFRRDFKYSTLNAALLKQAFADKHPFIAVIDASFIKKSGKKTDGLAMFWNGSAARAEHGLEISALGVVDTIGHTAYALDTRQTIDCDENSRVDQYAKQVEENADALKAMHIKYLVTDGYYSKVDFINNVITHGLQSIGKLRRDANLWWPYDGPYCGRGRKKKYDSKVECQGDLTKWTQCYVEDDGTQVCTALLHSKSLKRLIRVVLMRQIAENGKHRQALLFSTDVDLEPKQIIAYYRLRFQIEFVFRDAKQHTGLTDFQCRHQKSIHTHVNVSMTTLNLIKLEDKMSKNCSTPTVISIASWRRRKCNENLMHRLFERLDVDLNHEKIKEAFEMFRDYGCMAA